MPVPDEILTVAKDIREMRIRGAGPIASSALKALGDSLDEIYGQAPSNEAFFAEVRSVEEILLNTRPTAVALPNAISFVDNALVESNQKGEETEQMRNALERAIGEFLDRMDRAKTTIAENAVKLIPEGTSVMTHCHSTVVISLLKKAMQTGVISTIYVKETRPLYQGLITARQLSGLGADIRLIVDSASAYYMNQVDMVVVGADAIALNGDLVNKIGTLQTAIIAKKFNKRFLVAAETYKFAPNASSGKEIPIEFRSADEVVSDSRVIETGLNVLNPSFDITPHEAIDWIVTEMRVLSGDLPSSVARLAKEAGLIRLKPF